MRKYLPLLVSLLFLILTLNAGLNASPHQWWPMFQRDAVNSGWMDVDAPETPQIFWVVSLPEKPGVRVQPVTFENKTIITTRDTGKVICFDTITGEKLWMNSLGVYIHYSSPIIYNGKVIVCGYGKVAAFDLETGDKLWEYTPPDGKRIRAEPTLHQGILFLPVGHYKDSPPFYIVALDPDTGTEINVFTDPNLPPPSDSGIVGYGDLIIFGTRYKSGFVQKLYALRVSDLSIEWVLEVGSSISPPTVADGIVYVGLYNSTILAVDASTGSVLWKLVVGSGNRFYRIAPVYKDGVLYVAAYNTGLVAAIDTSTQTVIWTYDAPSYIYSQLIYADGKIYFGCDDDYLRCLDASNGNIIWEYKAGDDWQSVSIVDIGGYGIIIAASNDYNLYAFGSIPMFVTLEIEVLDENGNPLPNAHVQLFTRDWSLAREGDTGGDGKITFFNVQAQDYIIKVTYDDRVTYSGVRKTDLMGYLGGTFHITVRFPLPVGGEAIPVDKIGLILYTVTANLHYIILALLAIAATLMYRRSKT